MMGYRWNIVFSPLFLTVLLAAYAGKMLDIHSAEYYDSLRPVVLRFDATHSDTQEQLNGYCLICHFRFFTCAFHPEPPVVTADSTVLRIRPVLSVRPVRLVALRLLSLRAPPRWTAAC